MRLVRSDSHYELSARLARRESCYEISFCKTRKKRFLLQNFAARLASRESHYEISFCKTRQKRFLPRNFVARLASCASHCKISFCETREKRVLLLILTHESRENLVRILGLHSESRFSREFQKVILLSTLAMG